MTTRDWRSEDANTACESPAPLALRRKLGFAVGDFGLNLYWQSINLFLLYFYTDVFKISAWWAGTIFFLASIWDGAADPLVAILADRTNSRFGSYRPYLLFGAIPLACAFVAAFSHPGFSGAALIVYALVMHIALRTAYTVLNIPYAALSARMPANVEDRTSMVGYRMQFAYLGALTVTFLLPVLVQKFGGDDTAVGYRTAAACIGALSVAVFLLCFFGTSEAKHSGTERSGLGTWRDLLQDARGFFHIARHSRVLLRVLAALALFSIALTFFHKNLVYLLKYEFARLDMLQYILPLCALANLIVIPLWVQVIHRYGKRAAWIAGSAVMIAGLFSLYLVPRDMFALAVLVLVVISAGSGAHAVCIWSLLPDVVDEHGRRFGRRDEAKVFGLWSFLQKVTVGASAMLLGVLLGEIGLVADAAQSDATLRGLRTIMCLLPILCLTASALVLFFLRMPTDPLYVRRASPIGARSK
ncbi:MFS transporter [Roseiterribacter gracilis]|uniref:Putative symporter YnaJ n=1 Tax=Roseiterribacter gracilis TaxID=2812848 RepID=A0A8S8XI27_9PROT|nr:putative symporter YnaJ [Rhodospirillales bacterium TMPK1]